MVTKNKMYRTIEKYKKFLKAKTDKIGTGNAKIGYKSKLAVLDFFVKNNRWPKRTSTSKREVKLAVRFENYVSRESSTYDAHLRRLVFASGLRTTNNKRKHDVQGNKDEILQFMKTFGRVPASHSTVEGEGRLRNKLEYYTKNCHDTVLLGKVYAADRCHRSGIPSKFRAIINASLDVQKPLIRLVKS